MQDDDTRTLRRDAAANRQKLLDAASTVFAEHGLDAGVEQIARAAGVGMGTLYRRFPTKQVLIDELVGGARRELLALARTAARRDDGTGLADLLRATGQLQADHPACLQRLWNHSDAELDAMSEFRRVLRDLLEEAQATGQVRTDVTVTDLSLVLWSLRGVLETTRDVAPTAWRRHLELVLAGLRPGSGTEALAERPLTDEEAQQITRAAAEVARPQG